MLSVLSLELLLLLFISFVSGRVLGRSPEPIEDLVVREVDERDVCVVDDWLIGFRAMQADSYPFCSSLLGLGTLTGTVTAETAGVTAYTTETTTTTDGTVRIASATKTVTTTVGAVPAKRDAYPKAEPAPMVALPQQMQLFQDATSALEGALSSSGGPNTTILNTIYSACSCLHPQPRQVTAPGTATTTRIQTVIYRSQATQTDFYGETTETVTATGPAITSPPLLTGVSPTPSGFNISSSESSFTTLDTVSSGLPSPSINVTVTPLPSTPPSLSASTGLPSPSTNLTPTSPSPPPVPTPLPPVAGVCPDQDGEILTMPDGARFQILCYIDFPSVPTAGLPTGIDVPTFGACVQGCEIANDGFSAYRCRGVTYDEGIQGINCFFKNYQSTQNPQPNYRDVSAVLLNPNNTFPVPPSELPTSSVNTTNSGGPTGSVPTGLATTDLNSTIFVGPTGSLPTSFPTPNGNSSLTTRPTGSATPGLPPISLNSSIVTGPTASLPSTPSIEGNNTTSVYSVGPTASPPYTLPSISGNATSLTGPTGSASTGLPPITVNMTSLVVPTASLPSASPSISANATSSAGPTAPWSSVNSTLQVPSLTPSHTANLTSTPSLTPTYSFNITSAPAFPTSYPAGNDTGILPTGTGFYNSSNSYDPRTRYSLNSTCRSVATSTVLTTKTIRSTQIVSVTRTAIITMTSLL